MNKNILPANILDFPILEKDTAPPSEPDWVILQILLKKAQEWLASHEASLHFK